MRLLLKMRPEIASTPRIADRQRCQNGHPERGMARTVTTFPVSRELAQISWSGWEIVQCTPEGLTVS